MSDELDVTVFPPSVKAAGDPRGLQATWTLLPPPPDVCSQCARDHEPQEAHDQASLHYQYAFYAEHGRWPSWEDAMAHCDAELKTRWRQALRARGIETGRKS